MSHECANDCAEYSWMVVSACDRPLYYYKVAPAGEEAERMIERLKDGG